MSRSRERGYAIAMALFVMVLVGAAATAIAIGLELETRTSQQEARRIHLTALTDAALAEALAELARDEGFRGAQPRRFGNGTIESSVRVIRLDRVEIVATATLRGWTQRVVVEVVTSGSLPIVATWRLER